MAHSVVCE